MLDFFPSDLTNLAGINSVQVAGTEGSLHKESEGAKVSKELHR